MGHGPGNRPGSAGAAPTPGPAGAVRRLESPVLDLVFVVAAVALFALVSAVAAGVERL
ncbi:hypothetical protein [Cellulomonas sp. Y8]|uniref:hypothetical protein n=1 Tax=Cellulomonas sp. Y8 TaxID=2591145 RepID=UPI00143E0E92|nr:hypothetical protein [Cellulomonas sp. Y8]